MVRVGLQVRSVLVLAVVVLGATATGGWLYFVVTQGILREDDRRQADRMAASLSVAAASAIPAASRADIQKLVSELTTQPKIRYAGVLDASGKLLAHSEKVALDGLRPCPADQPTSLSYANLAGRFLEIGRPVVVRDQGRQTVAGAVRLVVDTSDTTIVLSGLRREIMTIAVALVLGVMPLGYLLVWRVMVVPVRRLADVTRRLAEGDFAARVEGHGGDEIGDLGESFNQMADKLHESQGQLRSAKESLERRVGERTVELEDSNRKLRDEMAEKEDFLRAVSHDLGAPLRNIAGIASMIATKWRDELPEEVVARLHRIGVNADAEMEMIQELLELSRIKTRPEMRAWVDFGDLMRDLQSAFEYELREKNITLDIDDRLPRLYVERNRMRQVFQNLLDNAIKFMGAQEHRGQIEVGYERSEGMHVFRVADTGPGVPPEERERIFYVFRRAATAASSQVPGKGVGLAVVKSIVSNYDGKVWVEPAREGGSVFLVALSARCTEGPDERLDHDATQNESQLLALGPDPSGR